MNTEIDEPIDAVRLSIGKPVLVKCRNERELRGKLHAYDAHLNMMLSDVEETIHDSINKTSQKKNFGLLFLRGDLVIVVIPSK